MDIDDRSIGIVASIAALGGMVVAHVVQIFRSGRGQGILEGRISEHHSKIQAQAERLDHYATRLENMQNEFDEKLGVWFHKIDDRVQSIESQFITPTGDPRFVTHAEHKVMQHNCQLHLVSEMGHLNSSIINVQADVNKLAEKIELLTTSVAVLSITRDSNIST